MGKKEDLSRITREAEEVTYLAEKDGQVYVTFGDAATLNSYNSIEKDAGTGLQTRNRDGSLASTGKRVHAVNPEYFFMNRYKVKGKKLYIVSGHTVDGYRCIKEQASGRVFLKTIPVYVIARDEDKNLFLEKITTVSDSEFISDYTNKLDNKSMAEILPLLTSGGVDITANEMPI